MSDAKPPAAAPDSPDAPAEVATPAQASSLAEAASLAQAATPAEAAEPAETALASEEPARAQEAETESEGVRSRRWPARRKTLVGVAAGAALVLLWAGTALATTQHLFGSSSVSGVAVGGMSPAQARTAIAHVLAPELEEPVTVTAGQASDQLVPAESGVSLDAQASVRRLTGFTLNPLTLISRLRGETVAAVAPVDAATLRTALDAHLETLSSGTKDATVSFDDTTPVLTPAVAGTGLDVEASVAQLSSGWPVGQDSVALVSGQTEPAVTDAEAQALIDDVLTPLLSGDLTVTAEGTAAQSAASGQLTLTPEQVVALTSVTSAQGEITASLDPDKVHEAVLAAMGAGIESAAQDSSFTIEGSPAGTPSFVAATPGAVVDSKALADSLLQAGTTGKDATARTVPLELSEVAAAHAESEAELGVAQVVGEYATAYYYDPVRTQNLVTGTAKINGTLVRPGETFSLAQVLGPIDAEHGFTSSGVLSGGVHSNAMGGGLSQVTTTTFNAAFEAGMDDVEHHPHSVWFTRYPAGREATLWTGHLDLKWKNSTPYAALVQAWAADGQVHVRLWSTPYYTVSITSSDKTNIRPVQVVHSTAASCVPYGGGQVGFDITVTRSRRAPEGASPADDVLSTSYQADNVLVCPSPEPAEPAEAAGEDGGGGE
ncbi:MAG: VanW family protein [Actinomyces urogenitalis]|uniref:VanW family protein n=1 Tax=Actinomyces urogenitalis TaxID=103621 RepID=UPI00068A15CC|nr:VanW family protein [Actinomyces urogenitalis]MDU5874379.1 VanW family protein [Actinomyces urogenitalis]